MYKILRGILFYFDAEGVHYFTMNTLQKLCRLPGMKELIRYVFTAPVNLTKFAGLSFQNKVGLGAGFDKNALYLQELALLGFGFVEIGTVTPKPQTGNEKPRLFRLKKDKALINRMGFNNDGAEIVATRLEIWKRQNPDSKLIIGGNIGKNKSTPNEEAWKDYLYCFEKLLPYADYFVVNVSSPNTPGLRALQEKDALRKILTEMQNYRLRVGVSKPILLKIAPDLSEAEIDDLVSLALEISLDGFVAFNTTLNRNALSENGKALAENAGSGGLSGKPLHGLSSEKFKYLSAKCAGRIPLMASGGIFTGADAQQRIKDGALLIQVFTGFIYEGPKIIKRISESIANKN